MGTRSVRMRLLVSADRELRDVTRDRTAREIESHHPAAGAAFRCICHGNVNAIGNEIRLQPQAGRLGPGGKIIWLAIEAMLEVKIRVEDEVQIFIKIDD